MQSYLVRQVTRRRPDSRKMTAKRWHRNLPLYLMILPGFLFFLIFRYVPMGGILIAFQDYSVFKGFTGSDWVGFEHFRQLFADRDFWMLLRNTLLLSLLNIVLFFPAPVILAILLHEARLTWFKKLVQTVLYMPHFLSWVVVVGITVLLFATQDGAMNKLLASLGFARLELLTDPNYFPLVYVIQNIWKEVGWGCIIFLAVLSTVDPSLYEASAIDGAGRWKQVWHITLPALKSTVIILFILRMGQMMETGFEHIYLMQNSLNMSVSDVFDTYVYRTGILQGEMSYPTAVGLFKSCVGLVLVVLGNALAKKAGEEGVY